MLDVSRDRVPTLETLKALIRRLASWKINHFQLYTEHTFAYRGHEEVWAEADPYTPEDIAELVAFCRDVHIDMAPNQNCLGHLERWLRHPRYLPLAVSPGGWSSGGEDNPPQTIRPADPLSLELVRDLLGQLVPLYPSRYVHVGLDEPHELYENGRLPEAALDAYIRHLTAIRDLPELAGREVLIWGDIVARHPDAIDRLPAGVTVVDWNYDPGHDFAPFGERLAEAGVPSWVCPSTGTFATIAGRLQHAIQNQVNAARGGMRSGARAFLNTEWGDRGYHQYLPAAELPLAFGAAVSWCLETNPEPDLEAIDRHVFMDAGGVLSGAVVTLGNLFLDLPVPMYGYYATIVLPFFRPDLPLGSGPTAGLEPHHYERIAALARDTRSRLAGSASTRADALLMRDELTNTCRLVENLCENARLRLEGDGTLATVPAAEARRLAAEVDEIAEEHRRLWLARNRPGGLRDSLGWLERFGRAYRDRRG